MIVIPVKDGENIERALKRFKRKIEKNRCCERTSQSSGFRETIDHTPY